MHQLVSCMTFGFDEVETTLLQHHQMSRSTVDDSSGKTPQVDVLSTMDTASRTSMSSDGDYHLYVDDDAAYDRYADRQNPTWLRRIAAALGMSSRRRRADASIADAAPLNGQPDTAKRWSSTHSRNRQGACLRETMRRVLIAVPILVLLFLYVPSPLPSSTAANILIPSQRPCPRTSGHYGKSASILG